MNTGCCMNTKNDCRPYLLFRWSSLIIRRTDLSFAPSFSDIRSKLRFGNCNTCCRSFPYSPILPSLHLRHSSFSNTSDALHTLQLILQPFRRFTYVTAHSPTLPLLHLCDSSFSNTFIALPTSQLILQPFFCFSYITGSSPTSPGIILEPLS